MSLFPDHGKVVVYDTEFTSWPGFMEKGFKDEGRYPEIIQIGAVVIDLRDGLTETAAFSILVMPTVNPVLSEYIQDLTGISQSDIDTRGVSFADALAAFLNFIPQDATAVVCHGTDGEILQINCGLNDLKPPTGLPNEIDLQEFLTTRSLIKQRTMSSALPALFGLESPGEAHNALDDARALASVIRELRKRGHL